MTDGPNSQVERTPYKLLDYYEEADATVFGGRDQEIFDITSRLASRGIVILYGPSGTGKTSVVRAGVFPQVRKLDWKHLYVRTLTNPIEDLTAALKVGFDLEEDIGNSIEALVTVVSRLSQKAPLLLTFDQFEEFFIRFRRDPASKLKFISIISNIICHSEIDCRVLLCVREDYFANFDEFRRQIPDIFDNSYRIGPLSAFGAREAIILPLNRSGIKYENKLINSLVAQLAEYGFDPVFLQILCSELVRTATRRGSKEEVLTVTTEDLRSLGGIEAIFQGYLESAIQEIEPKLRLVSRLVLDSLMTGEHTKQAMRIADFELEHFVASVEEVRMVLNALRRNRIVRHDVRGDEDWFELVHERLVVVIQRWIRSDPAFFNFMIARDLVEFSGRTSQYKPNLEALLNRGQVEGVITPFISRLKFTRDQIEFIFLSCIYCNSSQAPTWFDTCGPSRARQILLEQLNSDDKIMREGAARVMSCVPASASSELVNKCLEVSLNDRDSSVRRAAGQTFGRYASRMDLETLQSALLGPRSDRALEVYADFLSVGKPVPSIGVWSTFKAKGIARKRALREQRDFLSNRTRIGFFCGAAAAVFWSLFFIPAWLTIFPLPREIGRLGLFTIITSICFPLSCIFGVGLGGMFASHCAKRDVLSRAERWASDVALSVGYWMILLVYLLGFAVSLFLMRQEWQEVLGGIIGASFVPITWLVIVPSTMWLAQQCTGRRYTKRSLCGWPLLAAVITPVASTGLLLYTTYVAFAGVFEDPTLYFVSWVALALLATAFSVICLASVSVPRLVIPLEAEARSTGGPPA